MEISLLFKIAGIGIVTAILNQVLARSGKEEIAMLSTLAGTVIVLMMIINLINQLFDSVRAMVQF